VKKKSLKYLCKWTLNIERTLQNKEMKGTRLHKNQELHSLNKFEKISTHLKASSFKALVFIRV
jgi:hypothetical protein